MKDKALKFAWVNQHELTQAGVRNVT